MRKQYHFWRAADGDDRDAWDVDRLIDLSAELPVVEVPLTEIGEIDSVYWYDDDDPRPTVRSVVEHCRLIAEVDLSHPIILGTDGRVMDGMHRIARAMLEGRATIPARRFMEHPEPDRRGVRPGDLSYERDPRWDRAGSGPRRMSAR